jgi:hypothetical protein
MKEHVLSEELLEAATIAFQKNAHWVAYNTIPYFLEKGDVYFFSTNDEAHEFACNNISEYDNYEVFHAYSITDLLKRIPYGESLDNQFIHSNLSAMIEKNYDYLGNQLKYSGFSEDLQPQLKEKMQKGEQQFTLTFEKAYGKDEVAATLHFRKSDDNDLYFFNRYNLALKNDQYPDPIKQTFFINPKEENITLKEAYNLMSGRAVHKEMTTKEGEKYNAWLQLDFKDTDPKGNYKVKQFHENYNYDLLAVLNKHPIKELQQETDTQRLLESLQRGNRQSVTLIVNEKEQKVFIEALPQFKSLNIYDSSNQRLRSDKLYENNSQEHTMKEDRKQIQKQSTSDEPEPETGQKKTKRKRNSIT